MVDTTAKEIGVKGVETDFVQDVCHLMAGGEHVTLDELRKACDHEARTKVHYFQTGGNAQGRGTKWAFGNGEQYSDRIQAQNAAAEQILKKQTNISDFLKQFPDLDVPGKTPMYRALHALHMLQQMQQNGGGGAGEDSPIPGNDPTDIFNNRSAGDVAKEMKERLREAKEASNLERDMITDSGDGSSDLSVVQMASIMDQDLRNALKVARNLQQISNLKIERESKFKADPEGTDVRNRTMEGLSELPKIRSSSYAWMGISPKIFRLKSVTNQFYTRERGKYTHNRQLLYMLIDSSGSMSGSRSAMAGGVLMNRLMAVAKGDAVLYYRFFDGAPRDPIFVEDEQQARKAIQNVLQRGHYSGGGTNFNRAITAALTHIEEIMSRGEQMHRPEIMIVTDGQDSCNVTDKDLQQTKLHTIICGSCGNTELEDLSIRCRGVYTHVGRDFDE